jgi:Ca-activated chloride channel family protein
MKTVSAKRIAQRFDQANRATPKLRLFAFALGSDANHTLLEELARQSRGDLVRVRETDDIAGQLTLLFSRIGQSNIDGLRFAGGDPNQFTQVYSTSPLNSFDGSSLAFVGRYAKPAREARVRIEGKAGDRTIQLSRAAALPELETAHAHLPRVWAKARVDALLYEMNLNGEREDYIAEIIRLSQKYKFVTPYTAFLAAPRSLLRPRIIQPGDPVIRVKTDASIKEVFAVLPFGETLPLKFLPAEGVWETRFLAPAWMPDGTYRCRLLLSDKAGRGYQEEKSFVVDSHAPRLQARVESATVRAGGELLVRVNADRDTMRLVAKLYGAQPVPLVWSETEKACIGRIRVPAALASGPYTLTVSAEDFAHNQSSVDVQLSVIGR